MTQQEFITKYNFHDSLIDDVSFDAVSKQVVMRIDFAYWMQEWYTEDMAETDTLTIIFNEVSQFVCPEDVPWEQISIIQASLENDNIKFALMNDITDGYLDIFIKCKSISIA